MGMVEVALHMTLNTFYRLDIALGIIQYAREQPQWRLHGSFYTSRPILNYKTWQGHGIVALCHYRDEAKPILDTGLPIVEVMQGFSDDRIVNVTADHAECGRIAGRHLLDIGFTRFAFCHIAGTQWSRKLGEAFALTVGVPMPDMPVFERRNGWWQNQARSKALEKFLLSLPPRTAVMAGNDNAGVKITAACAACGRTIPNDLAVVGHGGDPFLRELSYPSLTTVSNASRRIGYEAARRLHELMRGGGSREAMRVPGDRLVVRSSTDTVVCDDEAVRRALLFIRRRFASNLTVAEVAREAAVCRRTLEVRFRRHLGRSVLEEIHANRLRHAVRLLEDTDLPVNKIHRRCGFMTHQVFYGMFRRIYGTTPSGYREHGAKKVAE